MTNPTWARISPLMAQEQAIDTSAFQSLVNLWLEAKLRVKIEKPEQLDEFYMRLRRQWAIETGILENLFMIDRSTTQTLIDRGFHAEVVTRAGVDVDPNRLVAILKDHIDASDFLDALISTQRPLSTLYVQELHNILTRNQERVESIDSLGNVGTTPIIRGAWKQLPNHIDSPNLGRVMTCPPELVQEQMEELLLNLQEYEATGVNVGVLAAWLHNRLTYIHPFQDGNGRVARALVNYLFVKAGLFPVVIDREDKPEYITALAEADKFNLKPLAEMFVLKQTEAIKQALSLVETAKPTNQPLYAGEVGKQLAQKRRQRAKEEEKTFREVNGVITSLWEQASAELERQLIAFVTELRSVDLHVDTDIVKGGTYNQQGHYYRQQVINSVKQADQWANFNEESRWIRVRVRDRSMQLRLVFSFHHVGSTLTGVAEVTSFAELGDREALVTPDRQATSFTPVRTMAKGPFTVTFNDDPERLRAAFFAWLTECLVIALGVWGEHV